MRERKRDKGVEKGRPICHLSFLSHPEGGTGKCHGQYKMCLSPSHTHGCLCMHVRVSGAWGGGVILAGAWTKGLNKHTRTCIQKDIVYLWQIE